MLYLLYHIIRAFRNIILILFIFSISLFSQINESLAVNNDELIIQNIGKPGDDSLEQLHLKLVPYKYSSMNFDPLKKDLNYGVLAGVGGITLATGIGLHIYQRNAWWKDQRRSFHFMDDNYYALGIDKVGHFYAGGLFAHLFSSGLEAANMQSEQAAIYGSLASIVYEMYVEMEDGFGPDWGFSPGDAVGDILGAGYSLSQYYFPFLKNFQFKFSYYPSPEFRAGLHKGNSIDDYEGQKYWLSVRVKNLLPEAVSNLWPSFLNIAGGMSIKNLDGSGGGYREFYIALDIDTEAIPLYGGVWQFIKNSFNYIHLPMPGIRISPTAAFFVFCF